MARVRVSPSGDIQFVYEDGLNGLCKTGVPSIRRASHVEPDPDAPGTWYVDLTPSGGPTEKGFTNRADALAWEKRWLEENRLGAATAPPAVEPQ